MLPWLPPKPPPPLENQLRHGSPPNGLTGPMRLENWGDMDWIANGGLVDVLVPLAAAEKGRMIALELLDVLLSDVIDCVVAVVGPVVASL